MFHKKLYVTDTDCKQQATVLLRNVKCQIENQAAYIAGDYDER